MGGQAMCTGEAGGGEKWAQRGYSLVPAPEMISPPLLLQFFWLIPQCQPTPSGPLTRKSARFCEKRRLHPTSALRISLTSFLSALRTPMTASPEIFPKWALWPPRPVGPLIVPLSPGVNACWQGSQGSDPASLHPVRSNAESASYDAVESPFLLLLPVWVGRWWRCSPRCCVYLAGQEQRVFFQTAGKSQWGLPTQALGLMHGSKDYRAPSGFQLWSFMKGHKYLCWNIFLSAQLERFARLHTKSSPSKRLEPSVQGP